MAHSWIQKQSLSPDHRHVDAPPTHDVRDFVPDPSGFYVLIRVTAAREPKGRIGLAVCDANHRIVRTFEGNTARDVWTAVFDCERSEGANWFSRKDHVAYLGKELVKAEQAVTSGNFEQYHQD